MKKQILGLVLIFFLLHTYYTSTPETAILTYSISSPTIEVVDHRIYNVYATAYHPTVGQCDKTPLITADMSRINPNNPMGHRWIGISQDMVGTIFNYGDSVLITNTHYERGGVVYRDSSVFDGIWVVHDCMNKRWKRRIDFLIGKGDPLISQDSVKIQKLTRKPIKY